MKALPVFLSAVLVSGFTLRAEDHKLTAENTTVKFTGSKKDGKHEGTFKKLDGTLTADAAEVTKAKLAVTIDIGSITTDAEKLTAHLKSPDFFDVKKHPEAKFASTAIAAGTEKDSYTVTGDFTMLGITKAVTFPAKAATKDGVTTISAKLEIKRSEWGMTYGKDKVNDEVQLALEVKLKAK